MAKPLAVLIVEDVESDAQLIVRMLTKAGYSLTFEQAETPEQMRKALKKQAWEIVISDFSMSEMDGFAALKVLQETKLDIPFIAVSGTMGEETAVAMMKAGAHDYVMKGNLARLAPAVERELKQAESRREAKRVEHQKQERAKELQTVFGLTKIIEREGITLDEVYQELTNILPAGWQYPEIAYARMVVRGSEFCTKNFKETAWKLSTPVKVDGTEIGKIEVGYLEKRLDEDEGSFQLEERELIDAIAERIGRIIERKQAEEALSESEDKFRKSIEFTPTPIAVAKENGELVFLNKRFIDAYGYTLEDLPTIEKWFVLAYPDTEYRNFVLNDWGKKVADALKNDAATIATAYLATCKNGEVKTVEVSAYFEKNYSVGLFQDITERKQAEDALRQKVDELERWQSLTMGRELKMIEFKKEINTLREQAGQPQKYKIADGT